MKITKTKAYKVFTKPLIEANPVAIAVLGICSALAVTTKMIPSIVMVIAMTMVLTFSNVVVSLLRHVIPKNIRIIVELVVISSLVILADEILQAFMFDVSKQLSVFVGLIITNCIIMGRAEAFALGNGPWLSMWDGLGNGLGYGYILIVVSFFRELFGAGSLMGIKVIPDAIYNLGYVDMGLMLLPPGVFVIIGLLIWIQNYIVMKRKGH